MQCTECKVGRIKIMSLLKFSVVRFALHNALLCETCSSEVMKSPLADWTGLGLCHPADWTMVVLRLGPGIGLG